MNHSSNDCSALKEISELKNEIARLTQSLSGFSNFASSMSHQRGSIDTQVTNQLDHVLDTQETTEKKADRRRAGGHGESQQDEAVAKMNLEELHTV